MLCLGGEESAELVDGCAQQSRRRAAPQKSQQPKGEYAGQEDVEHDLPFQEIEQVCASRQVAGEDRHNERRVEHRNEKARGDRQEAKGKAKTKELEAVLVQPAFF